MAKASVDFDLTEWIDAYDYYTRFESNLYKEMRQPLRNATKNLHNNIERFAPEASGSYKQTLQSSTEYMRQGRPVGSAITVSPLSYAYYVEHGRKPGKQPPIGAIQAWVIQKGIAEPGPASRSAAYVRARAIGEKGTKGQFVFKKGMNATKPQFRKDIKAAIARTVNKI